MSAIGEHDGDRDRADVERGRMPWECTLEPLQRAHRRGALAAEEQVQQRHEQAHAEALEEHHEEGAREHSREQERLPHEIRPQELEDIPEFGELLEPGFQGGARITDRLRSVCAAQARTVSVSR